MQNMSMFWRMLTYQIPHHSVLKCVAVCGSVWQFVAVCCGVLQCITAQVTSHSVLQRVAVCCSAYYEHIWRMLIFRIVVAVCCSVLQCVCSAKREQMVWCVMHVTKKLLVPCAEVC